MQQSLKSSSSSSSSSIKTSPQPSLLLFNNNKSNINNNNSLFTTSITNSGNLFQASTPISSSTTTSGTNNNNNNNNDENSTSNNASSTFYNQQATTYSFSTYSDYSNAVFPTTYQQQHQTHSSFDGLSYTFSTEPLINDMNYGAYTQAAAAAATTSVSSLGYKYNDYWTSAYNVPPPPSSQSSYYNHFQTHAPSLNTNQNSKSSPDINYNTFDSSSPTTTQHTYSKMYHQTSSPISTKLKDSSTAATPPTSTSNSSSSSVSSLSISKEQAPITLMMTTTMTTPPQEISLASGNGKSTFEWMQNRTSKPVNGKTRTKDKYRVVYTDTQRVELEKEFMYSKYITIKRKSELSQVLNLSERQIKIWFQNRRAKDRKQTRKQRTSKNQSQSSTNSRGGDGDEDEIDDENETCDVNNSLNESMSSVSPRETNINENNSMQYTHASLAIQNSQYQLLNCGLSYQPTQPQPPPPPTYQQFTTNSNYTNANGFLISQFHAI